MSDMDRKSLHRFARDLTREAIMRHSMIGCPDRYNYPRSKPGWMIQNLSPEKREMVKELKAKHFNHRF